MDTLRGPAGLPGCLAGRAPSPGALPQCEGNEKNALSPAFRIFSSPLGRLAAPETHSRCTNGPLRAIGTDGTGNTVRTILSKKPGAEILKENTRCRQPRANRSEGHPENRTAKPGPKLRRRRKKQNTRPGIPQKDLSRPPQQKATTNRPERYRNAVKKLSLLRQPLRPCHRNRAGRYAARRRAIARNSTAGSPVPPQNAATKTPRRIRSGSYKT